MISIDRAIAPPNIAIYSAPLDGKQKTAEREASAALEAFQKHQGPNEWSYDFTVYKDKELALELKSLFKGKCAYCESRMLHVSSPDIEHFRPKNAVNFSVDLQKGEKDVRPGYFWLAADWHNLLLSCPNCNRKAEQAIEGELLPEKVGKHTRFPMRSGFKRQLIVPYDIATEEKYRLLLNPCSDKPEVHLDFVLDGKPEQLGLVRSKLNAKGQESDMGDVSIKVYGLMRVDLVQSRRLIGAFFWRSLENMEENMRLIDSLKDAAVLNKAAFNHAMSMFDRNSSTLAGSMTETEEYLCMKRQLLKLFLKKPGVLELFNRFGFKLKEN